MAASRGTGDRAAVHGNAGALRGTTRRHDYAVRSAKPMLMDVLAERKVAFFGVGKIHDNLQWPRSRRVRDDERQRRRHGENDGDG